MLRLQPTLLTFAADVTSRCVTTHYVENSHVPECRGLIMIRYILGMFSNRSITSPLQVDFAVVSAV